LVKNGGADEARQQSAMVSGNARVFACFGKEMDARHNNVMLPAVMVGAHPRDAAKQNVVADCPPLGERLVPKFFLYFAHETQLTCVPTLLSLYYVSLARTILCRGCIQWTSSPQGQLPLLWLQ